MPDFSGYLQEWITRFPSLNKPWKPAGSWFVGNIIYTWGIGWNEGDGSYFDQERAEEAPPLGECDLFFSTRSYVKDAVTSYFVEAMFLVPSAKRMPPDICSWGEGVGVGNPGPKGLVFMSSSMSSPDESGVGPSPDFTTILDEMGKLLRRLLRNLLHRDWKNGEAIFQNVCRRMLTELQPLVFQGDLLGQGWVQLGESQSPSFLLRASDSITFRPLVDEKDNCVALFIRMD